MRLRFLKAKETRLRIDDLQNGTFLLDCECELYLKTDCCLLIVSSGKRLLFEPGQELPKGVRVVPKVTFHVELEGEG